jgi:hypothetical protein
MWIGKNSLPARGVRLQSDAARMKFIAHLPGDWLGTFCFLFSPAVFLAVTLVQKNPPVRSADPPLLIWDIDLTLASALPRNFRTTDDPLKANDGKTPSTIGLIDVHASGSGEFTADNLKLFAGANAWSGHDFRSQAGNPHIYQRPSR